MKPIRGCGLLPWLIGVISMLLLPPLLFADEGTTMSVSLSKGETYVINNVSPGATPAIKVTTNPHALVVHGAESGEWVVSVKMADGGLVNYDVNVSAVGDINDINHPGSAPAAIVGTGAATGSAAPVVAKLDDGAGPVASSSSTTTSTSSSPLGATTVAAGTETVTTSSTSASAPATEPPANVPAPSPATPPGFDFGPSVPAASYSPQPPANTQAASAALSNERYRTDPSISLSGGDLHSGAVSGGRHYLPEDGVQLQTGSSRIIDFATRLRRVSIADTTVADIQVINPFQVNLIGHKPGFTTLAIWDQQGQYLERPVRIDPNGKQQVLLSTMVAELDRSAIENQGTNLAAALSHAGISLVGLPGSVATPFSPQSSVTSPSGVVSSVNQTLEPG